MPTSQPSHQYSRNPNISRNHSERSNMGRSNGVSDRLRNEAESWVEISSQPSSSSISSIDNEIVTTGLRVSQHPSARRRRRSQNQPRPQLPPNVNRQRSTSSQEEYEESESEPDHIDILTSSNEISLPVATPARLSTKETYDAESEDDEDEDGTALGIGRGTVPFTPQPNAFSHPPSSQFQNHRTAAPVSGSYFPRQVHSQPRPQSYPSRTHTTTRTTSYNSYNRPPIDHDAALRASLTTLLSCAAAARGLPKSPGQNPASNEPMGLRIVPESELLGTAPPLSQTASFSRPLSLSRSKSRSSQDSHSQDEHVKRRASQTKENNRALKKKKGELAQGEEAFISPTLLTWVVSAGVVVLVSVVGFGAGYVIGREVGRQEASVLGGWNGSISDGSCGREVVRSGSGGLRRFKWGGSVARSIVA